MNDISAARHAALTPVSDGAPGFANADRLAEMIIENSADGVMVVDTQMRYLAWNPAIQGIHGGRAEDVLGKTVFEVDPGFANHQVGAAWRKAIDGGRAEIRDYRFYSHAREAEVSYDADFTPLRDEAGAIVGAICILHETTDRRRVEDVLRQSQKLEAVAQLTGGVAHDFNNLLMAVIGCLDLIEREQPSPRVGRLAELARRSAEGGAQLVQQLLSFARRQSLHTASLEVGRVLADIEVLLKNVAGKATELVLVPSDADPWRIRVDRAQLETSVMNLVINSRDAMPRGGAVTLRIANVPAADVPGDVELAPGEYVSLAVEDTGEGMDAETTARALDPFFTTKEVGKGSGLGLSMVHGFAVQSGGGMRLTSAPGVGTTVTLFLPRETSADAGQAESPAAEPQVGAGTVLLVEDDELVREISTEMLATLGYRVRTAHDGPEALALLKRGEAIDLLLTDIVMPKGMSGIELARQARAMRPDLAVLLATGYPLRQSLDADEFPVIGKPYDLGALSEAVGRVLATRSP
jgi:PAS domain S-box-containing protein